MYILCSVVMGRMQRPAPQPVLAAALGPLACLIAAALGPLVCLSRSARPRKARGPNLTINMYTNLLGKKWSCTKLIGAGGRGAGGGPKIEFSWTDPTLLDIGKCQSIGFDV